MDNRIIGEFMGTLVLVFLGNGVNANVLLKRALGENSGWIVIATGWGLAVMAGVFTAIACGSADAHINPAVTLGLAVIFRRFQQDWNLLGRANTGCACGSHSGLDSLYAPL